MTPTFVVCHPEGPREAQAVGLGGSTNPSVRPWVMTTTTTSTSWGTEG